MQLFLVDWRNNYGMDAFVIEAENKDHADELVKDHRDVWEGYSITPLVITGKAGTITYTDHQS